MSEPICNRYEFVLLFDVQNGNPNGDPDAGNMPRVDPETGKGIVTDVCIKRKIRNYVEMKMAGETGYDIYVTDGAVLNNKQKLAYEALKLDAKQNDARSLSQQYMCGRFFDVRTFGAVMDTGDYKCGQVRGPVQLCFSRSADVILQQEVTITRMAVTNEKDKDKERTMGRKYIVPYALYRLEGYITPAYAERTGFCEADLELLFEALGNMFEIDHSAARGKMSSRKMFAFKHESKLGNAPAHVLFDAIKIERNDKQNAPRDFTDYAVSIERSKIPQGVTVMELL